MPPHQYLTHRKFDKSTARGRAKGYHNRDIVDERDSDDRVAFGGCRASKEKLVRAFDDLFILDETGRLSE